MEADFARQLRQHLAGWQAAGVAFVRRAPPCPPGFFKPAPDPDAEPVEAPERIALATLAKDYDACTRCTALASTRSGTVPGSGPLKPRLFVLSDAPRKEDVTARQPLTGPIGETLAKMLTAIKIEPEEAYLSTALRCRPPGDRAPSSKELANCRAHLERELKAVEPAFILALGEAAARSLLQTDEPLATLRGTIHELRIGLAVCTHHPAAFASNPTAKREAWADLQMLMKRMQE